MGYVTDHAVLRYLERVHGINVEGIRQQMTVAGIDTAAAIGCDTVRLGNGVRLKLQGNIVSTCLGHANPRKRR